MLTYKISIDSELKIVKVKVFGEVNQAEGEKVISEARTVASDKSFDILYDMRETTTKAQLSTWFQLPRELGVFKLPNARKIKVAILLRESDPSLDQYKFFETVAKNLGLSVKVFVDEDGVSVWFNRCPFETGVDLDAFE